MYNLISIAAISTYSDRYYWAMIKNMLIAIIKGIDISGAHWDSCHEVTRSVSPKFNKQLNSKYPILKMTNDILQLLCFISFYNYIYYAIYISYIDNFMTIYIFYISMTIKFPATCVLFDCSCSIYLGMG